MCIFPFKKCETFPTNMNSWSILLWREKLSLNYLIFILSEQLKNQNWRAASTDYNKALDSPHCQLLKTSGSHPYEISSAWIFSSLEIEDCWIDQSQSTSTSPPLTHVDIIHCTWHCVELYGMMWSLLTMPNHLVLSHQIKAVCNDLTYKSNHAWILVKKRLHKLRLRVGGWCYSGMKIGKSSWQRLWWGACSVLHCLH